MARNDYKWDGSSRDERHSEFAQSGHATTTGAGPLNGTWNAGRAPRIRRRRRSRLSGLVLPILIAVGASALVLYGVAGHLHG